MGDDTDDRGREGRGRPSLRQRFRYRFDNLLARGTAATLIWLGAVTVAAVFVSAMLLRIAGVTFSGSTDGEWFEDAWQSMLRVMDAGTMAGDVGWGRRLLALAVTVFGLLVAGTLIGIIAAGVEDRIDRMRRGRSVVIESDHVVVLGTSARLPVVLRQLVLAAAEGGSRTIVVLADLDPADMHEMTAEATSGAEKGIRIVYRSGDARVPDDLALTRLPTARAAIVLSDQHSDVAAIETVLAISSELGGLDALTVVVELLEESSARRLQRAYGTSIHPINTSAAVGRTTAFALRQRGLSQVLEELLDFRGSDLHLVHLPELVGWSFGRVVRGLENARPIGLAHADGRMEMCPPADTRLSVDDQVIVVADDTRGITVSDGTHDHTETSRSAPLLADAEQEHLVMIGWNEIGRHALTGWAAATSRASEVEILIDPRRVDPATVEPPDLGPIRVETTVSDDVVSAAAESGATTVMFLAPPGDAATNDVQTMLEVEALRREIPDSSTSQVRFVVQLEDAGHAALLQLDGPDDLVVSDAMGSQFLVQLVDQPARRDILLGLYAEEGVQLSLVSCKELGHRGDLLVSDLVDRLAASGQLLVGWRLTGEVGVTLNPHLADRVRLDDDDQLIVVA